MRSPRNRLWGVFIGEKSFFKKKLLYYFTSTDKGGRVIVVVVKKVNGVPAKTEGGETK